MPPAPLPILAGVYYARIEATADAKQITNIVAFKKDGVPLGSGTDAPNALAVTNAIIANWAPVAALLHVSYTGVQVATYALGSPLVPAQVNPLVVSGGSPGPEHFKQLAGRIKHTVTRRGRGSQHSSYMSPMSDADITVNGDEVTVSWRTNMAAAYFGFTSGILSTLATSPGGTWSHVQVSKFQNKVLTPNSFPIISSVPQILLSSQRRRLGRG